MHRLRAKGSQTPQDPGKERGAERSSGTEPDRSPGRDWASPVIAVAMGADRDIEVHLVIHVVGLGLAKVPLDA